MDIMVCSDACKREVQRKLQQQARTGDLATTYQDAAPTPARAKRDGLDVPIEQHPPKNRRGSKRGR